MPESVSQAQRSLFAAALAYKEGRTSDAEVTSNVREIADETSIVDLRKLAGTDPSGLPYKVGTAGGGKAGTPPTKKEAAPIYRPNLLDPKEYHMAQEEQPEDYPEEFGDYVGGIADAGADAQRDKKYFGDMRMEAPMAAPQQNEKQVNIGDLVGQYTQFGKVFQRQPMVALAQQLSQLADGVESQLSEENDDWYDQHTISRNVKEMKAYAKEFEKLAAEADEFNTRMQALYQDMGRVLERYFDVYDPADKGGEMLAEPGTDSINDCGSGCGMAECGKCGMHESCTIEGDAITMRALPIVRKKLTEASRIIFDRLPPDTKRKVIWRLL